MADVTLSISRIVGGGICVASDDGHLVYARIRECITRGDRVILSFENVTRVTTAFLNSAVGQLYSEFSEEEVRRNMGPPVYADSRQLSQLKLVVDRAKSFFKRPESMRKAAREVMGTNDED